MALTAAYQTDERSVSEVKKQPTDVYLLIAGFLACRLFYQALPGKLIFRRIPFTPSTSKLSPQSPGPHSIFCLAFWSDHFIR